jgi:hypothetical protein
MANTNTDRTQIQTASGLNILAGLWLIIAPFLLDYGELRAALGNDVIVGIIVASLAATRVAGAYQASWLSWSNFVLGAWLIIAPFILAYGQAAPVWNDLILGVIVLTLAFWSAVMSR